MERGTLVVVDGANLVNDVGRYLCRPKIKSVAPHEVQRCYYREWFDIDRLVQATVGEDRSIHPWMDLGIVIVRSRNGLGEKDTPYCMQGHDLLEPFWARQGSNPSSSVLLVDLPKIGNQEKGIDTSIVVHLFETMDRWDAAILFTNDTDFVPAVWSLRKRGKRVYCASHVENRNSPLVQACQHFFEWNLPFLYADRALFELLQPGGQLDQFLLSPEIAATDPEILLDADTVSIRSGAGTRVYGNRELAMLQQQMADTVFGVEGGDAPVLVLKPHDFMSGLDVDEAIKRHFWLFHETAWLDRVHMVPFERQERQVDRRGAIRAWVRPPR